MTVDGPGDITALSPCRMGRSRIQGDGDLGRRGEAPATTARVEGSARLVGSRSTSAINPLSVVTTSLGTFFLSHRGVELLTRAVGLP